MYRYVRYTQQATTNMDTRIITNTPIMQRMVRERGALVANRPTGIIEILFMHQNMAPKGMHTQSSARRYCWVICTLTMIRRYRSVCLSYSPVLSFTLSLSLSLSLSDATLSSHARTNPILVGTHTHTLIQDDESLSTDAIERFVNLGIPAAPLAPAADGAEFEKPPLKKSTSFDSFRRRDMPAGWDPLSHMGPRDIADDALTFRQKL